MAQVKVLPKKFTRWFHGYCYSNGVTMQVTPEGKEAGTTLVSCVSGNIFRALVSASIGASWVCFDTAMQELAQAAIVEGNTVRFPNVVLDV